MEPFRRSEDVVLVDLGRVRCRRRLFTRCRLRFGGPQDALVVAVPATTGEPAR
jgi:hypothetical protein